MLPLRRLEIRRHAQRDPAPGVDRLSAEGVQQAHDLGRSLRVGYTHLYTAGGQAATQTLATILAGMGRYVMSGVMVRPGLLSPREPEWRQAIERAGGSDIAAIAKVAEPLVREEASRLATELSSILAELPEGGYALAIGESPLIECAVYGLVKKLIPVLLECRGVVILQLKGDRFDVNELK